MANHRKPTHSHAPAIGGALLAGGMLLAGPAAMASAAKAVNGENGRPTLPHNAPVVNKIQKAGDKFFDNPKNSYINGSGAGALYHGLFGSSQAAATAAGDGAVPTQGLVGGVTNIPRATTCNIVVNTGC
jgi:hypothetical protein